MDVSQYAELFLTESREHLGSINQLLLEWERDPANREPLSAIFRSVHTIKGMAATMGYASVTDLAHRTENLLDLLRRGERGSPGETIQLLFRAADALEKAVEASVAGADRKPDFSALLGELDRAAVASAASPVATEPRASRPMPAPEARGRRVRVVIDRDSPLKGARALVVLRRAEAIGAVGAVEPPPASFEQDEFSGEFRFRLDTEAGLDTIEQAIRSAGDVAVVAFEADEAGREGTAASRARSIRVDLRRLDSLMDLIGELATAKGRLSDVAAHRHDLELNEVTEKIAQLGGELQSEIIQARMTPVWQVFDRFPRLVRDLARQLGKQVSFSVEGKDIELDRAILDEIGDPLVHLLRNAIDHGIESPSERQAAGKPATGRVVVTATRERASVAITVSDDGQGIDRDAILTAARRRGLVDTDVERLGDDALLRVLARPGFSTAEEVSDVSGRGVGIDVVATRVRAMGGALEVATTPGKGTTFTLRLPTTLAIVRALLASVGEERYAVPLTHVAETVELSPGMVTRIEDREAMTLRDQLIPLRHLRQLVNAGGDHPARRPVVVLQIGERRAGLVVDAMLGQQEIVVKPFDAPSGTLPIFSGATILSDGAPALILDAAGLV